VCERERESESERKSVRVGVGGWFTSLLAFSSSTLADAPVCSCVYVCACVYMCVYVGGRET